MRVFADSWLKEARIFISSCRKPAGSGKSPGPDLQRLAEATGKAIKAALVESHGTIPQHYNYRRLVATCQSSGLWEVLPPSLKNFVQEVEPYSAAAAAGLNETPHGIGCEKYFSLAPKFVDYIEQHVIGNDSVLNG